MDMQNTGFEALMKIKEICRRLIHNPKNVDSLKELQHSISTSPDLLITAVQPTVLSTFYPVLHSISKDRQSYTETEKLQIITIIDKLLQKSHINKLGVFFNLYGFLLFECYNHLEHKIHPSISEEYKLSIMLCTKSLMKSISGDLVLELYTTQNTPKLCQMLYVANELAKNERMQALQIAAIECIMAIARVLDESDFEDLVVRNQIAEMFVFFLPGIATGLKTVILSDEKVGHRVPMIALRAWGRIVALLMQDYNAADEKIKIMNVRTDTHSAAAVTDRKLQLTSKEGIRDYLKSRKRTPEWYRDVDKNLEVFVLEFRKLTHRDHPKLRSELIHMCKLLLTNCLNTMPRSLRQIIEIVIILTEDTDEEIKTKSVTVLNNLSTQLSSQDLKTFLESMEEGFHNCLDDLPRIFNGIDEEEKVASLNLIIGYLILFGQHRLTQVLLSARHLQKLMQTLIQISELKKCNTVLEVYNVGDYNLNWTKKPWKDFQHFRKEEVLIKLEKLCSLLAIGESFRMVTDYLLDVILYEPDNVKEAVFLLNGVICGCEVSDENNDIVKTVLNSYIDSSTIDVPLEVGKDEFSKEHTLAEVHHNIVQVCLVLEGIGKIAVLLKSRFSSYLFKTLYLVFEKAGSSHPYVSCAGALALENITTGCGYRNITELITMNIDYLSNYIEKKLRRHEDKQKVLSAIKVVLKYSSMEVLPTISHLIYDTLESCDKYKKNATEYLEVFNMFIQSLKGWLGIEKIIEPLKSKAEKLAEEEDFKVSGIQEDNFSDDIMGKSAEEMFREDMAKKQKELQKEIEEPPVDEFKKPEAPLQVNLTVAIIKRALNFLPSKDRTRRLIAIEVLVNGVEVIRDWEDELLPIVHQVWSPLVERFKEFDNPLIINYSFQLLVTLSRLSKDFIRMRTSKEVLPSILQLMHKLAHESYLKDKGSAYRYTQAYKLQLCILQNVGRVAVDLDIQEDRMGDIGEMLGVYLSNKQPIPLQTSSIESFKAILSYDESPVIVKLKNWQQNQEFQKNVDIILEHSNSTKLENKIS